MKYKEPIVGLIVVVGLGYLALRYFPQIQVGETAPAHLPPFAVASASKSSSSTSPTAISQNTSILPAASRLPSMPLPFTPTEEAAAEPTLVLTEQEQAQALKVTEEIEDRLAKSYDFDPDATPQVKVPEELKKKIETLPKELQYLIFLAARLPERKLPE